MFSAIFSRYKMKSKNRGFLFSPTINDPKWTRPARDQFICVFWSRVASKLLFIWLITSFISIHPLLIATRLITHYLRSSLFSSSLPASLLVEECSLQDASQPATKGVNVILVNYLAALQDKQNWDGLPFRAGNDCRSTQLHFVVFSTSHTLVLRLRLYP